MDFSTQTFIVDFSTEGIVIGNDIRDIKPIWAPPVSVFFFILLLFIFACITYYFFFRKKKQILYQAEVQIPEISPQEKAYKRLEELLALDLIKQGKIKEFYIELSDIIRRFIQEKYNVPAIERTTDELFYNLKSVIDKKRNIEIKEFLESCDLVKFAKYIPNLEEINNDSRKAKEIIDRNAI